MGDEREAGPEQEKPNRYTQFTEPYLVEAHGSEAFEIPDKFKEMHELREAREGVESAAEATDEAREAANADRELNQAIPGYSELSRAPNSTGFEPAPSFSAEDEAFFAEGAEGDAEAAEAAQEAKMVGSAGDRLMGGAAGAFGMVGGALEINEGVNEWNEGKHIDGGADIAAGGLGVAAGGIGLTSSIAGGAVLGGGLATAATIAAPVAAVAGLAALGEHEGEKLGWFGNETDADGKTRNAGAFEAAADWGHDVTESDGALVGGLAYGAGEVGAFGANALLGVAGLGDGLGSLAASTGLFGKNSHGGNREAFGALDAAASSAGDSVTSGADSVMNYFGIDTGKDSVGGEIASGLGTATHVVGDVAGAGLAAAADAGGAILGAGEAAGHWIADFF